MADILEIALAYVAEGWSVVPIPFKQKRPTLLDWQTLRIGRDDAPQYFNSAPQNIGVILGEASHGLTDIDLDCDEAVRAAPYILPRTRCFGRASKRASHWLYYTDLAQSAEKATLQWKQGPKPLLECRVGASGAQTIFPGSTHPSGELVTWEDDNPVATIDGGELVARCTRLAAVALLARNYPAQGIHEAALVIGGFLAGCGYSKSEAKLFAEAVCAAEILPPDRKREIVRTVCDTVADAKGGKSGLFGYPKLREVFGDECAKKCAEWLGFKRDDGPAELWPADTTAESPPREEAPLPTSPADYGRENPKATNGKRGALRFVMFKDIDPQPRKVSLVEGLLGAGETSCFVGAPGCGKSVLLGDLAFHVAAGLAWLGRRVTMGGVLYIAAERSKLTERRFAALRKHHGIDDLPLALISGAVNMLSHKDHVAEIAAYAASLTKETGLPVVLIVIDTVSRVLCGGDENSPKDMGAFIANLAELGEITGAHISLVHHVPQNGDNRLRGHGSLGGGLDVVAGVAKSGTVRTVNIQKDNDIGGVEDRQISFDLQSVTLSIDPETQEETTAPVVIPVEGASPGKPAAKPVKLTNSATIALRALREAVDEVGEAALASNHAPPTPGLKTVTVEQWRTYAYRMGVSTSEEGRAKRQAFQRAIDALVAAGAVGMWEPFVWVVWTERR